MQNINEAILRAFENDEISCEELSRSSITNQICFDNGSKISIERYTIGTTGFAANYIVADFNEALWCYPDTEYTLKSRIHPYNWHTETEKVYSIASNNDLEALFCS